MSSAFPGERSMFGYFMTSASFAAIAGWLMLTAEGIAPCAGAVFAPFPELQTMTR